MRTCIYGAELTGDCRPRAVDVEGKIGRLGSAGKNEKHQITRLCVFEIGARNAFLKNDPFFIFLLSALYMFYCLYIYIPTVSSSKINGLASKQKSMSAV